MTPEEVIALFTFEEINEIEMKTEILSVVDSLELVRLRVTVDNWRNIRDDDVGFHALLQMPRRWEELILRFANLEEIQQMLDILAPCLPYLEELKLQDHNRDRYFMCSSPDSSFAVYLSKTITFPLHTLSILFNIGILSSSTMLKLDCSYFKQAEEDTDMQKSTMKSLPHILSNLPYLETLLLSIPGYCPIYYEEYNTLKVRSESLRTLILEDIGKNQESFLALFSDCRIEAILTHGWGVRLTKLAGLFPSIKAVYIVSYSSTRMYMFSMRFALSVMRKIYRSFLHCPRGDSLFLN